MSLAPDQVLQDRYRVVRIIKSGGMGSVYEAIDTKLADSPCAVKEILEEAKSGQDAAYFQSRFYEEMKALAGLDHPAIPKVRDYLTVDSTLYLVMELVQGASLQEELAEGPLQPETAVQDMLALLGALSYLHEQSPPILHRDVKPANILRDRRSGTIKLVDFGLARQFQGTQTQTMVGTMGYASPDQMMGKSEPRSDLYSVGVTLEHLLTGRMPQLDLLQGHRCSIPGLRPGLVEIIEKATQPKVEDRYGSARQMAQELQAWLSQTPLAPREKLSPVPSRRPPWLEKLPWAAGLLLALAVGVQLGGNKPPQPAATATLIATAADPPTSSPVWKTPQESPERIFTASVSPTEQPVSTPTAVAALPIQPTPAAQDQALHEYLRAVTAELEQVRQIGQNVQQAMVGIMLGLRPGGSAQSLSEVAKTLQQLGKQLDESRGRINRLSPPPAAHTLYQLIDRDYALWLDWLDQSQELLKPGLHRWRPGKSGHDFQNRLRLLTETAEEAKRGLHEVGQEIRSLGGQPGMDL